MTTEPTSVLTVCPSPVRRALARLMARRRQPLFVAGGPLRDLLLQRRFNDLDLTVPSSATAWARDLAAMVSGAFVPLDPEEDVARVVFHGFTIDFSSFRENSQTIEEDLRRRDFTMNALGLVLETRGEELQPAGCGFIDPCGGLRDIAEGVVRVTSRESLERDPLRLLRAFRFQATLGFRIEPATFAAISELSLLAGHPAPERLAYELRLIMESGRAAAAIAAMVDAGVFFVLFPEFLDAQGMKQPASHHLDVFQHSLATLARLEDILTNPALHFPSTGDEISAYLDNPRRRGLLAWAALCHDLGKVPTRKIREDLGGRITFYNHDLAGGRLFEEIACRLRWSREDGRRVRGLIEMHMWPFHLNNARRRTRLTPRAYLKLVKAAGDDLAGLFLLAMADSLAGEGEGKPDGMEDSLLSLYAEVEEARRKRIQPVLAGPRLLNGHDLQQLFGLEPGPEIGTLLEKLERSVVDGQVSNRQQAIDWMAELLAKRNETTGN